MNQFIICSLQVAKAALSFPPVYSVNNKQVLLRAARFFLGTIDPKREVENGHDETRRVFRLLYKRRDERQDCAVVTAKSSLAVSFQSYAPLPEPTRSGTTRKQSNNNNNNMSLRRRRTTCRSEAIASVCTIFAGSNVVGRYFPRRPDMGNVHDILVAYQKSRSCLFSRVCSRFQHFSSVCPRSLYSYRIYVVLYWVERECTYRTNLSYLTCISSR